MRESNRWRKCREERGNLQTAQTQERERMERSLEAFFMHRLRQCNQGNMTPQETAKQMQTEWDWLLSQAAYIRRRAERSSCPPWIQAYVDTVCSKIRWKSARKVVAEELQDHILEQKAAFQATGMSEEEAKRQAIAEMGDGASVGEALDEIHRPQSQWKMICVVALLMAAGGYDRMTTDAAMHPFWQIALLPMMVGVFLCAYLWDMTQLMKYRAWIVSGTGIICLLLFGGAGNGACDFVFGADAVLMASVALWMPLPFLSLMGWMRNKGIRGYLGCWLALGVGVLSLLGCGRMSNVLLFGIAAWGSFCTAVSADWFGIGRRRGIRLFFGMSLLAVIGAGLAFLLLPVLRFRLEQAVRRMGDMADGTSIYGLWMEQLWESSRWIGAGELPADMKNLASIDWQGQRQNEWLLAQMAYVHGKWMVAGILTLFAVFFVQSFRQIRRQKSVFARMAAWAVWITLLFQVVCCVAFQMGCLLIAPYAMPFLSDGGAALLMNAALMGILLSIFRRGDILRDRYL